MKRAALRHAGAAVTAAALVGAVAAPVTTTAAPASTRTISYHGYQAVVPASWRVVDLARDPNACVRFDIPSVYLGHPGDQSTCPSHLVGRTAGLVIEPLDQTVAPRVSRDVALAGRGSAAAPRTAVTRDGTIEVAVESAGVLVTASHAPDTEDAVRQSLEHASLAAGAEPASIPRETANASLAASGPQPGSYLGKGFDTCGAPSQSFMDKWLASSPYRAIGVYTSGASRGCSQPNLTSSWVTTQTGKGWHLIPIDVAYQAPCSSFSQRISTTPATARSQGSGEAQTAAAAAQALGLPAGSAIYSDIEGYTPSSSCTGGVLSYLSGFTEKLHALGYLSGLYSSGASGIKDAAAAYNNTAYTRVDHLWFAWWNKVADTNAGSYAPASYWANHQRLHQYNNLTETWGGSSLNIDTNYLDVGTGTPPPVSPCAGVNLNATSYPQLNSGATGAQVTAAQCLLQSAGYLPNNLDPSGVLDATTAAAVKAFQQAVGLAATGAIDSHTWTALLSAGDTPTLRSGSTGAAVERLQRALTAALARTVAIDGQFGAGTDTAVRNYQTAHALGTDGIVGAKSWVALQAGK
jgi:peptidoglycan hydrolase-like protein with peptidoglycan-binding domain